MGGCPGSAFLLGVLFFLPKSRIANRGSRWFTSRKGSRGSPASRALLDPFERETERAQSHLGTYDDGIDKTQRAQVLLQLLVAFGHSSGQRESVRRIISAAKSMLSRNAISRAGEGLPSSADSFRHAKIAAITPRARLRPSSISFSIGVLRKNLRQRKGATVYYFFSH